MRTGLRTGRLECDYRNPANIVDPSGLLGLPSLQDVADFASGVYRKPRRRTPRRPCSTNATAKAKTQAMGCVQRVQC